MINKQNYTDMMNEIHVPSEMLGKVTNMKTETKFINRKKLLRKIVTTAAAFTIVFVASNAVCYAASGQTWVESVIIYINGEPTEQEITYEQNGDQVKGSMSIDVDGDGNSLQIDFGVSKDSLSDGTSFGDMSVEVKKYPTGKESYLEVKDDKLYLIVPDFAKIDITGELDDGSCEGSFSINDMTYQYMITGNCDEYSIDISTE